MLKLLLEVGIGSPVNEEVKVVVMDHACMRDVPGSNLR
jgi:hypothetical protein